MIAILCPRWRYLYSCTCTCQHRTWDKNMHVNVQASNRMNLTNRTGQMCIIKNGLMSGFAINLRTASTNATNTHVHCYAYACPLRSKNRSARFSCTVSMRLFKVRRMPFCVREYVTLTVRVSCRRRLHGASLFP